MTFFLFALFLERCKNKHLQEHSTWDYFKTSIVIFHLGSYTFIFLIKFCHLLLVIFSTATRSVSLKWISNNVSLLDKYSHSELTIQKLIKTFLGHLKPFMLWLLYTPWTWALVSHPQPQTPSTQLQHINSYTSMLWTYCILCLQSLSRSFHTMPLTTSAWLFRLYFGGLGFCCSFSF